MFDLNDKRIRVVVGHYGSGKTEFAVNYALKLAMQGKKTALVDLDIANPYFRSRERQTLLEESGVLTFTNTFGYDITADLPAITARIRTPLEDKNCNTVVDVGGDNSGAKVLVQFGKYFTVKNSDIFCVVNGNRPETNSIAGALEHIEKIETVTELKVTGLVNNTHLIKETTVEDILRGYELAVNLSMILGIPLKYNCCASELLEDLTKRTAEFDGFTIFPMELYMRESWLDRKIGRTNI